MITESKPKINSTFIIGHAYLWPCAYCDVNVRSARGLIDAYLDCTCVEGKLMRERGLADDRQEKLEKHQQATGQRTLRTASLTKKRSSWRGGKLAKRPTTTTRAESRYRRLRCLWTAPTLT